MPNYSQPLVVLELLAGYIICGLVAVIGFVVVWKIATGKMDISTLLCEKDATGVSTCRASMARFQLLIFIFVIALSFFLVVARRSEWCAGPARYQRQLLRRRQSDSAWRRHWF